MKDKKNKTRNFIFRLGFTLASVELGTSLAIITISQSPAGTEPPEPVQAHVTKRAWVQNPVKAMGIIEDLTGKKGWVWVA